jgi:hypothetical protein
VAQKELRRVHDLCSRGLVTNKAICLLIVLHSRACTGSWHADDEKCSASYMTLHTIFALECRQDGMHDGSTLHCTVAFQRLCSVMDYVECIGCLAHALQCALHCMPLLDGQWSALGVVMHCHNAMHSITRDMHCTAQIALHAICLHWNVSHIALHYCCCCGMWRGMLWITTISL